MDATHQSEVWKPIPEWEGRYEVSNQGRVRSLPRTVQGRYGPLKVRGKVGYGSIHKSTGYYRTGLYDGPRVEQMMVHRAVLLAFVGPLPEGMHTRHLNGNPLDNRLCNLKYDTVAENMRDKRRHGTNTSLNKTHCPQGHEYTPDNTLYYSRPDRESRTRKCRECNRIACRKKHSARKARKAA